MLAWNAGAQCFKGYAAHQIIGQHFSCFYPPEALTQGRLLGFAKVTRDLTDSRNHEEALRRSEERFRLLVEGVSDYAIFMLDVNGHVASWNAGAQRIKGYAAEDIVGQHFSVFYSLEDRESAWPQHELHMATETGSFVDEGWRVRKDGTRLWAHVTISALRDDGGRLLGFAKLTRDLTERKSAEAASQQREESVSDTGTSSCVRCVPAKCATSGSRRLH